MKIFAVSPILFLPLSSAYIIRSETLSQPLCTSASEAFLTALATASIGDLSEYTRVIRVGSTRLASLRPGTPIGPFWAACACALKLRRFHLAAQTEGDFKARRGGDSRRAALDSRAEVAARSLFV